MLLLPKGCSLDMFTVTLVWQWIYQGSLCLFSCSLCWVETASVGISSSCKPSLMDCEWLFCFWQYPWAQMAVLIQLSLCFFQEKFLRPIFEICSNHRMFLFTSLLLHFSLVNLWLIYGLASCSHRATCLLLIACHQNFHCFGEYH